MFETRLTQSIKSLDFTKMLESSNVSPILASSCPCMWALRQAQGRDLASIPCCLGIDAPLQYPDMQPAIVHATG